ncbi:MAG: 16S rRNA (guanine(527)-N(7))-methyltransferase RsmG [Acidimicrobiales bacterium]
MSEVTDDLLPPQRRRHLLDIFTMAQAQGLLGPGPVDRHIEHSLGFALCCPAPSGVVVDLGSGAGVPGLPLALLWCETRWVLLEAGQRRADWLRRQIEALDLGDRVTVRAERAETAGRSELRHSCAGVVARAFAGPAVTAECAAPLLQVDGFLAVAEPPGGRPERWEPRGLAQLGLRLSDRQQEPVAIQLLRCSGLCPPRYPRRVGVPGKRPLF